MTLQEIRTQALRMALDLHRESYSKSFNYGGDRYYAGTSQYIPGQLINESRHVAASPSMIIESAKIFEAFILSAEEDALQRLNP